MFIYWQNQATLLDLEREDELDVDHGLPQHLLLLLLRLAGHWGHQVEGIM